ncbi:hypothetical protein PAEPH01_0357 [Pancytospora epiphaga]|nr:hypothetical protein PAEPH01_0357 [Pancytospora epiphaga]
MFSGFPSYFVSSTSMIFYRAGGKSRASSAVGILVPALLAILAPYMRDYIPNILSSIILSYISMSFIYSYFIGPYRLLSNADFVIVVLGVVFCKAVSFAAGFAIVTAVCAISVLRFYGNTIGIRKDLQRPTENVVCVDYILCFITIGKLKQDLAACSQEVTLDLTACPYIDANGNMFILEYSQEVKRIQIIGNPYNLYKDRLNAQPNIHVLDTRY